MDTDTPTSDTPWTSEEDAGRRRRVGAITGIIDLSGDGCATDDGAGRAGAGTGAGAEGPTPTTVGVAVGGKRKATSKVWLDFDEMFTIRNGKKVRYGAKCKYCGTEYSGKSSSGTGHLKRHALVCGKKKQTDRMSQSLLKYNPDGSIHHWEYKESVARIELCRLIAKMDLPLGFGESNAFEEYITRAHNPRFSKSSRQTTTRDFVKHFDDCRAKLKGTLLSSVSSVCLTSDIWSGNAKEDYISVVAHFVNADWELEKRLLALRLIDESHTGAAIAERISMVVEEYDLTNKIFAITLDNASSNSSAMDILSPIFSGYILAALPPDATEDEVKEERSLFMHQRCACHIINLTVKSGMKRLKPYIEDFRTAISFLNSSNQRIAAFKSFCACNGVRPRKFGLDMDVRWNSTYLMLKHVVPYRSTFSTFIQTHHPFRNGLPLLTDNHWYVAEKILQFLELFYDSTVALSGVYYPTSSLMLHHVLEIAAHLHEYENDELLRPVVVPMKHKFLRYWRKNTYAICLCFCFGS
jgi:hypothetical protein